MDDIPERIGRAIKAAIEESPLTQTQIAAALAVSPQTLSRWANGHVVPTATAVVAFEDALQLRRGAIYRQAGLVDSLADEDDLNTALLGIRSALDHLFGRAAVVRAAYCDMVVVSVQREKERHVVHAIDQELGLELELLIPLALRVARVGDTYRVQHIRSRDFDVADPPVQPPGRR